MKTSKKLCALILSFVLMFACFAMVPFAGITAAAATNGIYMAKLSYTRDDTWRYLQNEFTLAAGTYQFDVDYATEGSVAAHVTFKSGATVTGQSDANGHIMKQFTWGGGTFNVFLRDNAFTGTGTIYFANPVLKAVSGGVTTGDNLIWDFERQNTEGGTTITETYAWGGKWYKSGASTNATFTVEKDGRNRFSTSDKGASYMAKLNYTRDDTWRYLQNEFTLAAGTYQFDVDYMASGSVAPAVTFKSGATTDSTADDGSHITVRFTWTGGAFNLFLRDNDFKGTGTIYFANPVLKAVSGGVTTGDNLVWDFSRQYTEAGATITETYAWGGKWYKSSASANATFTVEKDTNAWFPERLYVGKLNYTTRDGWTYLQTEMNLEKGPTYQFDVDYVTEGSVAAKVGFKSGTTVTSESNADGHITLQFTWAGSGDFQLQLRDNDFDGTGIIYFANPVLKKVEGGNLTGVNLVWDFYKQFTFVGSTITKDYGYNGRWYRSKDSASATFTVEVDANGFFDEEDSGIAFKTHSLVLGENIGLNFLMDLSALSAEEKAASYMTFAVTNSTKELRTEFAGTFTSGDKIGFTCPLSSIQMAETVTPTFHYGDGETLTGEPYSVKDYIDYVVANSGKFPSKVVTLVKALGDYGHYAQSYLGSLRELTYTGLAKYRASDYTSSDYSTYVSALSGNAMVKNIDGTAVSKVTYNLNFDSTTYINVKMTAGEAIIASATVDGKTLNASSVGNFRTQGLMITKLGTAFTLSGKGTANTNTFTVTLSGLSYIRAILNGSTFSTAAKNAMAALYDYYNAAVAYAG